MSITIPVKAELNQQDVSAQIKQMEAALNDLGRVAQDAGRVKFTPVSNTTLDELKRIRAEFEAIQRMAPGLKKALEAGGQGGKVFDQVDWDKVWTNPTQRGAHAASMLNRFKPSSVSILTPPKPAPQPASPGGAGGGNGGSSGGDSGGPGGTSTPPPTGGDVPGRPARPGRNGGRRRPRSQDEPGPNDDGEDDDEGSTPGTRRRRLWRRVAGSALVGGAGGIAGQIGGMTGAVSSGALSGGMMGGPLGAVIGGLAGALTGILGAMSGARDVAIALDTLKRNLGDTGVSFDALQASTRNLSDEFGLSDAESTKLTSQYARTAGSGKDPAALRDEVGVGVGFSRAFGLDPSAGVGFFGQMRGMGITQNADDSKRLALLIGESVAKAGDLPRLGDVLAGLSRYMENSSRISLTAPNSAAWLSRFAGLERSGLSGMDPTTAASIIGNIDNSIRAGGVTEAGRNFMSGVLQRDQGLNAIQAQIQLEGGAFGTGRSTFGGGSAMERFYQRFGGGSPSSSWTNGETNISTLQNALIRQYRGKSPDLMLDAFKNTFGTSYGQAAAWMASDPIKNDGMLSRLQRLGINWKDVNAAGVSKISQIEADGSLTEAQKDEATKEAASKNQEDTVGSEARANAAKTANAVERLANEGLPMLNTIQAGILKMAGVDTPGQLLKQIEHAKRKEGIEQDLGAKKDAALKERNDKISFLHRGMPGLQTPEEAAVDKKYWDAKQSYDQAMDDEDSRFKGDLTAKDVTPPSTTPGTSSGAADQTPGSPATVNGGSGVTLDRLKRASQSDALHGFSDGTTAALIMQESNYNPQARSSAGALGPLQIMPENVAALSKRAKRQLDPTNWDDAFYMYDQLMAERDRKYGGDTEKKLRSYHGGYDESKWGDVNADYVPAIERRKRQMSAAGQTVERMQHNVGVDVTVRDQSGNRRDDVQVTTSVGTPTASGVRP